MIGGAAFRLPCDALSASVFCIEVLHKEYKMSYYDVDSILNESTKIPAKFQLDVPGLGYIDGNPGETVRLFSVPECLS